jgi:hypothetical protein
MAIGTDDAIDKFGTADDLNSSSAAVADAAFSVAGDLAAWTNDDDAPEARVALQWQYPSGTLTAGAYVELHARRLNYTGTTDEEVPSDDYRGALVGRFKLDDGLATATNSQSLIDIKLVDFKSSQEYEFYIKAMAGVQISAGWDIEITPMTVGPHA